jgi:predicted nucleic-acid-binding Zn-ribbon protein
MQQNINVDINQTSGVTCEECGGIYFDQALVIRKASGLLTGTGTPAYIPIPVFSCKKCGHVNGEFLPKEVQSLD